MNALTVPAEQPVEAVLLRIDEVARLLSLGRSETYRLVTSGELVSLKLGRRRLIPRAAIDALVAKWVSEQLGGDAA
jgi:excisionase family DNA binding protein